METKIKRMDGFTRYDLAKKFGKLGFNEGVEVGVCRGKYSEHLCKHNPNLHMVGIDDYGIKELRGARVGAEKQQEFFNEARKRLELYNYEFIRKMSMEAVLKFNDESLDFVYIDAGHQFDYVMCDLIEWGRRVRKGGIISGHDYYRFVNGGVVPAVDIYCKMHKVKTLYLSGEKKDRRSSFWFEKKW